MKFIAVITLIFFTSCAWSQTQYEYAYFSFSGGSSFSPISTIYYPDYTTVDIAKKEPDVQKQLVCAFNLLGSQGYRLVTVTETKQESLSGFILWTYYFIREKQ